MGVNKTSDITGVGEDVLSTAQSAQTGLVTAQLGDVVTEDATSNEAEWYYPPGLVSRPRKPDAKQKAAQVVKIRRSGNDAIVGCRDERIASIIGQLDDGETAVFAPAQGGGVVFFRKDGSIKVQAGSGGATVTVGTDGSVKIGGVSPVALARGDVMQVIIAAIVGSTPSGTETGYAALKLALTSAGYTGVTGGTPFETKDTTAT